MPRSPADYSTKGILTDPLVLAGSALSAFGLIGIVDTALAWRSLFKNFFSYWLAFRDRLFSIVPVEVPSDYKDIIIINIAAASIVIRSSFILDARGIDRGSELRIITLGLGIVATIYGLLFIPIFGPMWDAVGSVIDNVPQDGIAGFFHAALEGFFAGVFIVPFVGLITFILGTTYSGLFGSNKDPDGRATAIALLSNSMLVFGFVAAIVLLFARW